MWPRNFFYGAALIVLISFNQAASQGLVNQQCLGCICEAVSGCSAAKMCVGDACGPFRMTSPFWIDAGQPTVNGESGQSHSAYNNCANDIYCSTRAVQAYMARYQRDCNGDGRVDCDDFAKIHMLGPFGCYNTLSKELSDRYFQCKGMVGGSSYIKLDYI